MKRYLLLSAASLLAAIAVTPVNAENINGIFAWVDGSATCFKLDQSPEVFYTEVDGVTVANLSLRGATEPVLKLPLENGATLEITYGEYTDTPSGAETISVEKSAGNHGRKIIKGGRLIIVKDGRFYDINGIELKQY
ncbi:MAG: hypothetical protein ACI4UN_06025 [Muribaculaceae bacterium]